MKSDAQAKRDELVNLASKHGSNLSNTAQEYYSWTDARLKGFLRSKGLTADKIPSDRNQLLRTTRSYYGGSSGSYFGGSGHGILDSLKDGVRQVLGGVQDASGKIEQEAKVASISASSAASVASAKASSASAKAHNEL